MIDGEVFARRLESLPDAVTVAVIAAAVGRTPQTVCRWARAEDFPTPEGTSGKRRWYGRDEVLAWLVAHAAELGRRMGGARELPEGNPRERLTDVEIAARLGISVSGLRAYASRDDTSVPLPAKGTDGRRSWGAVRAWRMSLGVDGFDSPTPTV